MGVLVRAATREQRFISPRSPREGSQRIGLRLRDRASPGKHTKRKHKRSLRLLLLALSSWLYITSPKIRYTLVVAGNKISAFQMFGPSRPSSLEKV